MSKKEREVEKWITVNGTRVPIFKDGSIGGPKELRDKLKVSQSKKTENTSVSHYTESQLKDAAFRKEALAEMKRYERNWNYYSAKERRDISPNGVKELRSRIKEIENYEKAQNPYTNSYGAERGGAYQLLTERGYEFVGGKWRKKKG